MLNSALEKLKQLLILINDIGVNSIGVLILRKAVKRW